jgi:hypothetical protein
MATEPRGVRTPEPPWSFDDVGAGQLVWHVEMKQGGWQRLTGTSFATGDGLALFRNDQGVSTYLPVSDIKQIQVQVKPQPTDAES